MSFSIGGVRITIRFFFFAFLSLLSITAGAQMILSSVLFSLLHEFGHLSAMLWFGCKPDEVRLGAFGMEIRRAPGIQMSYRQEMIVLLAGPTVNLVFSAAFIAGGFFYKAGLFYPGIVNLVLAVFNLLPVSGTDGGEALYYALVRRLSQSTAHLLCGALSFVIFCGLYTLVFFLSLRGSFPLSLFGVLVYLTAITLLRLPSSR